MGEIVVDIKLENRLDRGLFERGFGLESEIRGTTIPAIADTGAAMLALPEEVVEHLGLQNLDTISTVYADGRSGLLSIAGTVTVRIGQRRMDTECIVLPRGTDALVGQIVMERMDLVADCVSQTLAPRPESPDRPLLRV